MPPRRTKKTTPKKTPPKDTSVVVRKTHRDRTYKTYIQTLFKSEDVHPDLQLKEKSKDQLDQLLKALVNAVRRTATTLIVNSEKVTISLNEVQSAISALISFRLDEDLSSVGFGAIDKFDVSKDSNIKSKAKRAGLIFPIGLTGGLLSMKEHYDSKKKVKKISFRTGESAAIFLAAVLERIVRIILKKAGDLTRESKRVQVTVSDLNHAVKDDQDLNALFNKLGIRMTDAKVIAGVDQGLLLSPKEKARRTSVRAANRKKAGIVRKAPAGEKAIRNIKALPGAKAFRNIKAIQDSSAVVIPKQSFKSLVKGMSDKLVIPDDYRYGANALDLLQRGIEDYMVVVFRKANALALHRNGKRVFPEDLVMVDKIMSLDGPEPRGYKKDENVPVSPAPGSDLVNEADKITKPAIKRLAQRGGVLFMGQKVQKVGKVVGLVYIQARAMIQEMLERVLGSAVTSTLYRKAKTLNIEDVQFGFSVNNLVLLYSPLSAKEKKVKATTTTPTAVAKKSPRKTPTKKSPRKTPTKRGPRKKTPTKRTPPKKSPKRARKKTPTKRGRKAAAKK